MIREIRGVLFDFDGTLTRPGQLDFGEIRREIDCPAELPILEFLDTLTEPDRANRLGILERFEAAAAAASLPNQGALELLEALDSRSIPVSVVTRNSSSSVDRALANFPGVTRQRFRVLISRDDPLPPKPDPAAVLEIAAVMGISPSAVLVVGDYVFDMQAGQRAGAMTALITNGGPVHDCGFEPDIVVKDLAELQSLIFEEGNWSLVPIHS